MFRFKVIPDEGESFETKATTRDVAKWEKTNKGASLAKLQNDQHMTDLYKVAYNAVIRQSLFVGTLQDFEESCDIDVLDDEADVTDPTQSAA